MNIRVDSDTELLQLQPSDAADIFHAIDTQRHYLGRWLPFVELTRDITDTQKFIDSVVNADEDRFEFVFVIRKHNEFAGLIGFKDTDRQNKKTEIGYWLCEKFQKQGIITRSVEKLCELAFNKFNINRIQIRCATANTASINIPKRLGFSLEGIERDGELLSGNIFTDLLVFSRLKRDK